MGKDDQGIRRATVMMLRWMEGNRGVNGNSLLTLDLASLDDIAFVVDLDLGASPGAIEKCLDHHVVGCWVEVAAVESGGSVGGV